MEKINKNKMIVLFRFFQDRPLALAAVAVLIILLAFGLLKVILLESSDETAENTATFEVKRGPLRISVIEAGTIKSRDQVVIKNEVEGRTSIIYLIPEGSIVKKGELLAELDSSQLLDQQIEQEIRTQNAEASFIHARENLAVVENQAESDIDKAKLALKFAKQDLRQYLEGEYPNQLKEAENKIKLAKEELMRAKEKLKWSNRLHEEKYISQTEKQADELAVTRKTLDLDLAQNNMVLLNNYVRPREVAQLESDVRQAQMALERVTRKASADVVQAQANLRAKESEFKQQQGKLKKVIYNITKTKIYAPQDGLVIYATSAQSGSRRFGSSREPLEEGQDLREREELIHLPTATSVKVETSVHESNLRHVRTGLPAKVTVDTMPGKTFNGTVAHIAPLPDARARHINPDLKLYATDIYLDDNDSSLRTGLSCNVEIIIEEYADATYVPVQAVLRVGAKPTVYVKGANGFEARQVEVGLDNNRMVKIINGLREGEVVLLTPPLKSASVDVLAEEAVKKVTLAPEEEGKRGELQTEKQKKSGRRRGKDKGRKEGPLSDEEREKMFERRKNMPPEEREKIREKRKKRQQQTDGST
jgi:HlyD family secretion protein